MRALIVSILILTNALASRDGCATSMIEYDMAFAAIQFEERVYQRVEEDIRNYALTVFGVARKECSDGITEERVSVAYNSKYLYNRLMYEGELSYGSGSPTIPIGEVKHTCWNRYKLSVILNKIASNFKEYGPYPRVLDTDLLKEISGEAYMLCTEAGDVEKASEVRKIYKKWRY